MDALEFASAARRIVNDRQARHLPPIDIRGHGLLSPTTTPCADEQVTVIGLGVVFHRAHEGRLHCDVWGYRYFDVDVLSALIERAEQRTPVGEAR